MGLEALEESLLALTLKISFAGMAIRLLPKSDHLTKLTG
jgi:hypothetical protein